jgi:WD40 repeat protein
VSVSFSNDGNYVVSESLDKTVRVWNMITGELDYILAEYSDGFIRLPDQTSIQYQSGGQFIISNAFHPRTSCFLTNGKAWILTDSPQRSCWIPERYRDFSSSHSCGWKMAFGLWSGSTVVLDLESG